MSNKTNIEEDINTVMKLINTFKENIYLFYSVNEKEIQAIENILADRERLEKENEEYKQDKETLENELLLGRINNRNLHFKANKYDSLVEKIKDKLSELKGHKDLSPYGFGKLETLQELLDTEKGDNICG